MTTKPMVLGRRARRTAASIMAICAALVAGCDDQPTEAKREIRPATRENTSVVYTAQWYQSYFYQILDENGDLIWQTEADLPLQGGYFTLAYDTFGLGTGLLACSLAPNGAVNLLDCPLSNIEITYLGGQGFGGPCEFAPMQYPFAHVLTTTTCWDIGQYPGGVHMFDTGDRVQLVAAPTAPGGRVFKRWNIKLRDIAADPYPCDEGQTSLTCTLSAHQDYTTPFVFERLYVIYGQPDPLTLGDAKLWIGLKNTDAVGLRLDLRAEVLLNGVVVGSGDRPDVSAGGDGFNNAVLQSIGLALANPGVAVPAGAKFTFRPSVRRSCSGTGPNSGRVRFWYDGPAIDAGPSRNAGSRFAATVRGVANNYFMRNQAGLKLATTAGTVPQSVEVTVNSNVKCPARPFASLGEWSTTLP